MSLFQQIEQIFDKLLGYKYKKTEYFGCHNTMEN
ncbi:hypothetical protein [Parabacteroides distasonis]